MSLGPDSEAMKRSYPKTWGNIVYEIQDVGEYLRFWWGRVPSSKVRFEEWLFDPDATMYEVSARHEKFSKSIQVHVKLLTELGILVRRKAKPEDDPIYHWSQKPDAFPPEGF